MPNVRVWRVSVGLSAAGARALAYSRASRHCQSQPWPRLRRSQRCRGSCLVEDVGVPFERACSAARDKRPVPACTKPISPTLQRLPCAALVRGRLQLERSAEWPVDCGPGRQAIVSAQLCRPANRRPPAGKKGGARKTKSGQNTVTLLLTADTSNWRPVAPQRAVVKAVRCCK